MVIKRLAFMLTPVGKMYVGRSINLYERIRSYFYKTPKYKGVSLIRNYFNKHGFSQVRLFLSLFRPCVLLVHCQYNFNELVNTEQAFLDFFKPALNLDKKATPTRYNAPMSRETWEQFIKQLCHPIAVSFPTAQLLWVLNRNNNVLVQWV
jgi:hypothetical protein